MPFQAASPSKASLAYPTTFGAKRSTLPVSCQCDQRPMYSLRCNHPDKKSCFCGAPGLWRAHALQQRVLSSGEPYMCTVLWVMTSGKTVARHSPSTNSCPSKVCLRTLPCKGMNSWPCTENRLAARSLMLSWSSQGKHFAASGHLLISASIFR